MVETEGFRALVEDICTEEVEMCSACNRYPAVNYGYCLECSGRRGFS